MECYIVRIYRRNRRKPHLLAGIVEEVGKEAKRGFENIDELKTILIGGEVDQRPQEADQVDGR